MKEEKLNELELKHMAKSAKEGVDHLKESWIDGESIDDEIAFVLSGPSDSDIEERLSEIKYNKDYPWSEEKHPEALYARLNLLGINCYLASLKSDLDSLELDFEKTELFEFLIDIEEEKVEEQENYLIYFKEDKAADKTLLSKNLLGKVDDLPF